MMHSMSADGDFRRHLKTMVLERMFVHMNMELAQRTEG